MQDDREENESAAGASALSRRQVVASALGGGFAVAVRPVSAETIITDTSDLIAGDVKIPTKDGSIPGYRAMPAKGKGSPVVLVVQEIFGVHEHIKDVCRRLAKRGYLAIAPELYARQGDVSTLSGADEIRSKVVSKVPDGQVMADLDAAVAFAKKNQGNVAKLGLTGFCWGGRIAWLYAAHSAQLKAAVAWYGRLAGDKSELQPKHPIDVAGALKAPVLGLYGGADQGIPLSVVGQMREALVAAKVTDSEIHVYPDAPHAFFADYRPSYRKEAAEDGWQRLLGWFKRHGVA